MDLFAYSTNNASEHKNNKTTASCTRPPTSHVPPLPPTCAVRNPEPPSRRPVYRVNARCDFRKVGTVGGERDSDACRGQQVTWLRGRHQHWPKPPTPVKSKRGLPRCLGTGEAALPQPNPPPPGAPAPVPARGSARLRECGSPR
ncbi:hypothetical protein NL676_002101 [Syzygium grande]|nr:hypothetical protein NL676_002101 [Syzygium grande]